MSQATNSDTVTTKSREAFFVERLEALLPDRAAMAHLRRGLGRTGAYHPAMDPHILRWIPKNVSRFEEDRFYLVASLFAFWAQGCETAPAFEGSFGKSLANLGARTDSSSLERRFVALLDSRGEDVGVHLRTLVGLLRSKDVPVDWTQLLRDLRYWDAENRQVRRQWSRDYWRGSAENTEDVVDSD